MRNEMSILKMVRDHSTHREAARAVRRRKHRSRHRRKRSTSAHSLSNSTHKALPSPPPNLHLSARKEDTDAQVPIQSTQVQGNESLALTTSETQCPSLSSRATVAPSSHSAPTPNEENKKVNNADVKAMLDNLMGLMRKILSSLNTPAVKAAVQLLQVLEPLLIVLQ
ncbi:hypothetical protein HPB51_012183 [Rhipicephalus microplus]|uniref:Uncharacterized protein n=1 Tax=Rhipicephalus microplus TaxID=6941 RepID=A0A9J6DA12_RHIMP|nr:hypothetical protein HPB51_012183 [Rhipicephalus microplus]